MLVTVVIYLLELLFANKFACKKYILYLQKVYIILIYSETDNNLIMLLTLLILPY